MNNSWLHTLLPVIVAALISAIDAQGQLVNEQFNYAAGQLTDLNAGANVSGGTWISFSGTGNALMVVDGNLSYTGYASSGVGRMLQVRLTSTSAEDAYVSFDSVGLGRTTYASMLLRVDSTSGLAANTSTTGGYFAALLPGTSTLAYVGRISIRKGTDAAKFQLGVRAKTQNPAAAWYGTDLNPGQTYLLVLGYRSVSGDSNDVALLWVDPDLGGTQPGASVTQTSAGTGDPSHLARFAIRQDAALTPPGRIDGLRIDTLWSNAPLPIQLATLNAVRIPEGVQLTWTTLAEANNYGFYVERSSRRGDSFMTLPGAFVAGHGTTTDPHSYVYTDESISPGTWFYRLRQVDLNGSVAFSDPVQVDVPSTVQGSEPAAFVLRQNYPNPFNPSTTIEYTLPRRLPVSLAVYSLLGQEVALLVYDARGPGRNSVVFDASHLPGGTYFCVLRAGSLRSVRRMLLVR
ncbi:MAG: Fibronectin type domain protein [Bacteroidetes bacterium]|jgi:hypothetical protein|nr:Fibronectin type domain protein [Bacteroidota bacterium]